MKELMQNISIEKIQAKLFDKLLNTGWDQKLRFFINSGDFYDTLLSLYHEVDQGKRFGPGLNDIFKCFELCHFKNLKVIFIAKEAHTDCTLTNGLALSHNFGLNTQWEFKGLHEELQRTVGNSSLLDADLSGWAKQGALLLNGSLTTRVGYTGSHQYIWNSFTRYLLDMLNRQENLIWIFFDETYWDAIDNTSHIKFKVPPLPKVRKVNWNSAGLFQKINKLLVDKKLEPIIW